MGKFASVANTKGKGDKEGDVTMVPFLPENPTTDQLAAYEAAFLEPVCEKALSEGILPNPNDPGGYFKAGDVEGWNALKEQITKKYKVLMKEDMKRRKPY